jgi:simple sugar transport system permease protein
VLVACFLLSGAIAGLAGGVEVSGLTFALYEDLSPGWGYTAIAVALLAGLDPLGVVVAGVLFGALQAGAGAMQRDAGIPAAWVGVVEALVILAVLGLDRVRRTGRGGPG